MKRLNCFLDTEYDAGRVKILETVETEPGRIETRRYALIASVGWLDGRDYWAECSRHGGESPGNR
jgi:hypothetical protein